MKRVLILIAASILYMNAEAKNIPKKNIPHNIHAAFKLNFHHIKNVQWSIEADNIYSAHFVNDKKEDVSAYFSSTGELIEYNTIKETQHLSQNLLKEIERQTGTAIIHDIIEVNHSSNKLFYVVNIMENQKISECYFDSDGKLFQKLEVE
jgi:hypothetical protein